MKRKMTMVLAAMMAVGLMAGCSSGTSAETEAAAANEQTEILVAAAASLKNAYEEELIPMFQEQNPGITVTGTYDSSGKLQTQIEEGLEADVFMSAATTQMDALNEEGLIDSETMVDLLENKIVLIVPSSSELGLASFEDIAQDKVSFGTNVTEVLNQVAAASADAGIVYATDAASMADQVTVIAEAPEGSLAQPVIYPVAVVKTTAHAEAAKAFVDFLQTDEAMAVFESYGFAPGQ